MFKQKLKSPTIFYSSEFEIVLDLHVDDGYVTRLAEKMFACLETNIVLKLSPIIGVGNSFEHVGALRVTDEEGTWVTELDKHEVSVLSMMQMKYCRRSTSPSSRIRLSLETTITVIILTGHSEMVVQEAQGS